MLTRLSVRARTIHIARITAIIFIVAVVTWSTFSYRGELSSLKLHTSKSVLAATTANVVSASGAELGSRRFRLLGVRQTNTRLTLSDNDVKASTDLKGAKGGFRNDGDDGGDLELSKDEEDELQHALEVVNADDPDADDPKPVRWVK